MNQQEIVDTIVRAGRERKILWVKAFESDGTVEPREVEPYSFRPKGSTERFFFYCLLHKGTRNFKLANILEVRITEKTFVPRYDVEF
jgi:predicted DNA-binding transcriptional regulator YafY